MQFRYKVILSLVLTFCFGVVQSMYRMANPVEIPNHGVFDTPDSMESNIDERVKSPDRGLSESPVAQVAGAHVTYSEDDDQISASTGYSQLRGDLVNGLIMVPSFRVKGRRLKAPDSVLFEFASFFTNTEFHGMTMLRIIADKKLVYQRQLRIISRTMPSEANSTQTEEAEADISYSLFQRLCESKHVEFSFGDLTTPAPEEALVKFKELQRLIDQGNIVEKQRKPDG
jgi:hypothetical protein